MATGMAHPEGLRRSSTAALALLALLGASPGCTAFRDSPPSDSPSHFEQEPQVPAVPQPLNPLQQVPLEKSKVSLPPYRIEPPDILYIDAIKVVPKSPYRISQADILSVTATGVLTPIPPQLTVEPGGSIDLGPGNGRVPVVGLSLDEATEVVERQLGRSFRSPQVSISLLQSAGSQQIAGEHIVAQDGRINLGLYGAVYVAGMTVDEARRAIEQHLTRYLDTPHVAVDVGAFNSKVYYIIFTTTAPGVNFGQAVYRFPITGNETVLDALSQVNGLPQVVSKHHIWISRPASNGCGCDQILPVNWDQITRAANTSSNYQLFPGDRIFIDSDKFYAADSMITKIVAPFERIFGFTTLAVQSLFRLDHPQSTFGGNNFTSHW